MNSVKYRKIQSGIYQLVEEFDLQTEVTLPNWVDLPYCSLSPSGILYLDAGYISDGPSGPTLDSPCSIRGAFVHDAFYRMMRRGKLGQKHRKYADQLIKQLCLEDGMWKIRAEYWYQSLRLFAGRSAKFNPNDGAILTAPKEK